MKYFMGTKNEQAFVYCFSLILQVVQSIILGVQLAFKYDNPNYYFLFLDLILLFALLVDNNHSYKTVPFFAFTVILAIEVHMPILNQVQRFNFLFQDELIFIISKIVLNCILITNYSVIIIYALTAYLYLFIRLELYSQPHIYLTFVSVIAIFLSILVKLQIMLFQTNLKHISFLTLELKAKDSRITQVLTFFQDSLPFPICIANQQGEILFISQQYRDLYFQLSPSLFEYIVNISNNEKTSIYNPNQKSEINKISDYQLISMHEYENCVLDEVIEQFIFFQELLKINNINWPDCLRSIFPLNLQMNECFWQGQESVILILGRQIEQKIQNKLQELTKQDECKNYLLASVSHDFKTPINGMVAIIEYLESFSNLVDQNAQYYLKIIKKNAFLLLFMIQDILDFSRIQKDQLRLTYTQFFIKDVVQEVIELIKIQAQQKGIKIQQSYPDQIMRSDPNRIKQILLNLLSNSLKFTEKGYIDITITSNEIESPGSEQQLKSYIQSTSIENYPNTVKVVVTDTGVGIPNNIKPKLFNLYATFDYGNGTNRQGNGLGLVICKKLVGLLGPTEQIMLESQSGVGSKFMFYLNINNEGKPENEVQFLKAEINENLRKKGPQKFMTSSHVTIFQKSVKSSGIQQKKFFVKRNFTALDLRCPFRLKNSLFKREKVSTVAQNSEDQINNEDVQNSKEENIKYLSDQNKRVNQNQTSIRKVSLNFQKKELNGINLSEDEEDSEEEQKKLEQENRINLLIVDDQVFNVMALKLLLNNFDVLLIDEAYNGEQAVNKVKERASEKIYYDYIFMDLTMPIMDGYVATQKLKCMVHIGEIPNVQIIALTGYDDQKEKEKCYEMGFDAFISKPVKGQDVASLFKEFSRIEQ